MRRWAAVGLIVVAGGLAVWLALREGVDRAPTIAPTPRASATGAPAPEPPAMPLASDAGGRDVAAPSHRRESDATDVAAPSATKDAAAPAPHRGLIGGRVLFDDWVVPEDLSVVVIPDGHVGETVRVWPEPHGAFVVEHLRPGHYRLAVVAEWPPSYFSGREPPRRPDATVAELFDLRVNAGEPCADPRLREIDVRGRLTRFQLLVTDASSAPIADARLVAFGEHDIDLPRSDDEGRVSFACALSVLDVLACADGYRPAQRESVGPHDQIVLADGIPVRLELAPPLAAPYFLDHWTIALEPAADDDVDVDDPFYRVGATGSFAPLDAGEVPSARVARFRLPCAGRYDVMFERRIVVAGDEVARRAGVPDDREFVFHVAAGSVTVRDVLEEQTFAIAAPDAGIESTMRALGAIPELEGIDVLGVQPPAR